MDGSQSFPNFSFENVSIHKMVRGLVDWMKVKPFCIPHSEHWMKVKPFCIPHSEPYPLIKWLEDWWIG